MPEPGNPVVQGQDAGAEGGKPFSSLVADTNSNLLKLQEVAGEQGMEELAQGFAEIAQSYRALLEKAAGGGAPKMGQVDANAGVRGVAIP